MNSETPVRNVLKARLAAGEPTVVLRLKTARTVDVVGLARAAGYHALYVDLQHSTISLDDTAQICTAAVYAGVTPLVRVPVVDAAMVGRLLDGGAMGIIVPDVQSADLAREAVRLCRMPPLGERSTGGPIALTGFTPMPGARMAEIVNAETMVITQLESARAIDEAEAIAAVDGVDALFIGSNDLTLSLGIPGQYTHDRTRACYARAIAAAKGQGKHLLIGGIASAETARIFVEMGAAPCFFPGADSALFFAGAKQAAAAFAALAAPSQG